MTRSFSLWLGETIMPGTVMVLMTTTWKYLSMNTGNNPIQGKRQGQLHPGEAQAVFWPRRLSNQGHRAYLVGAGQTKEIEIDTVTPATKKISRIKCAVRTTILQARMSKTTILTIFGLQVMGRIFQGGGCRGRNAIPLIREGVYTLPRWEKP